MSRNSHRRLEEWRRGGAPFGAEAPGESAVVAVDTRARVVGMSAAARRIMRSKPGDLRGQFVLDVTDEPRLRALLEKALLNAGPVKARLALGDGRTMTLRASAEALVDGLGREVGAIVVLVEAAGKTAQPSFCGSEKLTLS